MNVKEKVDSLIARSIYHDEIVSVKWTQELEDELIIRNDDSVEDGGVYQFWGEDDNGDDWRVHLYKPEQCDD